jgi:hypothetical protein
MYIQLEPILSILAGILILMIPKFLNFIVAFYLILVGVFSLVN